MHDEKSNELLTKLDEMIEDIKTKTEDIQGDLDNITKYTNLDEMVEYIKNKRKGIKR